MIDYSQYCANSKDDRKLFNEVCGIYAFCYNSEIIYIGQSRHIGKRIYAHMSETKLERTIKLQERYENNGIIGCYKYAIKLYEFIKKNRENIMFCIICKCNEDELNDLEEYYIRKYKPRFNDAGVHSDFHPYNPKK